MAGMMTLTVAEKQEIIHLVEHSALPVRSTLAELQIPRSTFYRWYQRFQADGLPGLAARRPRRRQFWNRLPPEVQGQLLTQALAKPEASARQLACDITTQQGYFVSESSVYRLLKRYDLITSPAYRVVSAAEHFAQPTQRVHELWQTDFTYFKILGWGW